MKTFSRISVFSFLFVLAFAFRASAQDDIILLNDNVIKARVDEVGLDAIKFHKSDNLDGPMYVQSKSEIYMIVYSNGSRDVINPRQSDPPQQAATQDNLPPPARTAPPEMPVYEQPYCPVEGYLWTPGYWAFGFAGYYWVPGVWVNPPHMGYLWTPGYWGYDNGIYGWNHGYWGEHIGFYGGVNYGYGYGGSGYYGGRWEGGAFRYNTSVSRVDVTVVHTTYVDNTVVQNNTVVNHSSFNGPGGVQAQPSSNERMAMSENHIKSTPDQQAHVAAARNDKSQYASANHGQPAVTAMNKPNGERVGAQGRPVNASNVAPSNNSHSMTAEPRTNSANPTHNTANEPRTSEPRTAEPTQRSQPAQQQHTSQPIQQRQAPARQSAPRQAPRSAPAPAKAPTHH